MAYGCPFWYLGHMCLQGQNISQKIPFFEFFLSESYKNSSILYIYFEMDWQILDFVELSQFHKIKIRNLFQNGDFLELLLTYR